MSTEAGVRKVTVTGRGRSRIAEASLGIGVLNCAVMTAGILSNAVFAYESPVDVRLSVGLFLWLSPAAAVVGFVLGLLALLRASFHPHRYGGKGTAIAGIGASLLTTFALASYTATERTSTTQRLRHEDVGRGYVLTMISAQAAYQSVSGHFGTPDCLMEPTRCVPDYPTNAPTFLDSALAPEAPQRYYVRRFYPGPAASASPGSVSPFPGNLQSFAYTAVPAGPKHTRLRSFCGDSTFRTCFSIGDTAPLVKDGLCDPGCTDIP